MRPVVGQLPRSTVLHLVLLQHLMMARQRSAASSSIMAFMMTLAVRRGARRKYRHGQAALSGELLYNGVYDDACGAQRCEEEVPPWPEEARKPACGLLPLPRPS